MDKFNKHIIIVGSARSGTSWLAETIAAQHRYRLLFEPEHEFNTKKGKLICDKLLTRKNSSSEANTYLKKVFSNRIDSDWIAQCSNRKYKRHLWPLLPKKYIIKFVRANLAAQYINENYQIPVIHLLRNPYDVIHSQQRVKFPWLYDLSHFNQQEELVDLVKSSYNFNLRSAERFSDVEKLALRWCLENVIPLKNLPGYSFKSEIVYYEELRNDLNCFIHLCAYFDLKPVNNLADIYSQPSSKTHPKSEIKAPTSKTSKFKGEEIKSINAILDIFECELYSRISL